MHTYDILRSPIGFWFCCWWVSHEGSFPECAPRFQRRNRRFAIIYSVGFTYGYGYKFIDGTMNYEAASLSLDFEIAWS